MDKYSKEFAVKNNRFSYKKGEYCYSPKGELLTVPNMITRSSSACWVLKITRMDIKEYFNDSEYSGDYKKSLSAAIEYLSSLDIKPARPHKSLTDGPCKSNTGHKNICLMQVYDKKRGYDITYLHIYVGHLKKIMRVCIGTTYSKELYEEKLALAIQKRNELIEQYNKERILVS